MTNDNALKDAGTPADAQSLPPASAEDLINLARLRRTAMPARLRVVADFLIQRPREFAVLSITDLAGLMESAPSALVRFAKSLGFSGFAPMQRVLKEFVVRDNASYSNLISRMEAPGHGVIPDVSHVLDAFFDANISALASFRKEVDIAAVQRTVSLLREAGIIAVTGQKRAFPLASYLFYGISMLECRAVLIDSVGGLETRQLSALRRGDALVAISFNPYAPDVLAMAEHARSVGCSVIAITDGADSPLVPYADASLFVQDSNLNGIRSIAVTSTLLQALFVSLGIELEKKPKAWTSSRRNQDLPSAGEA